MSEAVETNRFTNVGLRLSQTAQRDPDGVAVVEPHGRRSKRRYRQVSFRQLDEDSSLLADGLLQMGMRPGASVVLMVRPGIDFVSLVFAMLKAGLVIVLIDPGMDRRSLIGCLERVRPEGFIGVPAVQIVRWLMRRRFPDAQWFVTAGRRLWWGGRTLHQLRSRSISSGFQPTKTRASDPAAIIFTTGSTGPPKGVLYSHGNFDRQVDEIQQFYAIQPGEIDLAGFPLFGLFNCAMGVTTVVPDMDPTRPAQVDPRNIVEAVSDWSATQSFASPALWNVVSRWCEREAVKMPSLRRVLSAGAPVPAHVLLRTRNAIHPEGEVHTPYGATEALPVASISATEVLGQTAGRTARGAGTCVGRRFPGIRWRIIQIDDGPIETIDQAVPLPSGQIGELIVQGEVVTRSYVTDDEANRLHKIRDGDSFWHRMGDVGYLDAQQRFWFCGRKSQRVRTASGTMYTVPCESILNTHSRVYRSALVGLGPAGNQQPVMIVEPWPEHWPKSAAARRRLVGELAAFANGNELTARVQHILLRRDLPVDIRHNAKIFREQLGQWAAQQLS